MNTISAVRVATPRFGNSSNVLPMLKGLLQAVQTNPPKYVGKGQEGDNYSVNGKNITLTPNRGYDTLKTTAKDNSAIEIESKMFNNEVTVRSNAGQFKDTSAEAATTFNAIKSALQAAKPSGKQADPSLDIF